MSRVQLSIQILLLSKSCEHQNFANVEQGIWLRIKSWGAVQCIGQEKTEIK